MPTRIKETLNFLDYLSDIKGHIVNMFINENFPQFLGTRISFFESDFTYLCAIRI